MAEAVVLTGSATTTVGGFTLNPPEMIIQNLDAFNLLYFGFADTVTTGTGFPVRPGETVRVAIDEEQDLYVVAATTVPLRLITFEVP